MIRDPDYLRRFWDGKDLQVLMLCYQLQQKLGDRALPSIREHLFAHFDTEESRLQNLYLIESKKSGVVPLRFNKTQQRLYQMIQEMRAQGLPVRIIIVKARQQGVSAFFQLFSYNHCETRPNRKTLTVNYDDVNAEELFGKAKFAHDNHPCALATKRNSAGTLEFAAPHYSTFHVRTAGSPEVARGLTLHGIHASEIPLWRDAETVFTACSQAVPADDLDTWIVKEATARGAQGHFYDAWQDAVEGRGGYWPFFSPWFWQDEYTKPFRSDLEKSTFMAKVTPEDREYKARYGLSWEQMHWRRWKTETDLSSNPFKFREEFPASAEEAFVSTGRSVFQHEHLVKIESGCTRPQWLGDIVLTNDKQPTLVENPGGMLAIWDYPHDNGVYVVGADVAEGKVRDKGTTRGVVAVGRDQPDYSVGIVMEANTGVHVASWHGYLAPIDFATALSALAWLYNQALVVPEVNGPGISVIEQLVRVLNYPNIYVSKLFGVERDMSIDNVAYGFRTTASTRPILINHIHRAVGSGLKTRDRGLARELRTMEFDDNGVARSRGRNKDDRVLALGLALQGVSELLQGSVTPNAAQEPKGPDAEIWKRVREDLRRHGQLRSSDRDSESFSGPGAGFLEAGGDWLPHG